MKYLQYCEKKCFKHPFKPAENFAPIGKQITLITIHKGQCCLIKRCKHSREEFIHNK